jgi:extracellular elastinolytic metalloproteinase
MRRTSLTALLGLAMVGGLLAVPGFGAAARPAATDFFVRPFEHFDARTGARGLAPNARVARAIAALAHEHPDVRLDWNASFGTVKTVLRYDGALSGPRPGSAPAAARAWLARHAGLYGWTAADVGRLPVVKDLQQPRGGPRIVLFHQLFAGGLEGGSFGGSTVVALDRENRILSVRSNVVPTTAVAAGARLSEADALRLVTGIRIPRAVGRRGEARYTEFAAGGFAANHYVRRVAFPVGGQAARPAHEVYFVKALDEGYRVAVDAVTGKMLYRHQLVVHQAAPEGRIFKTYPGAPLGGEHEIVSFAGDPVASPLGWVATGPVPLSIGNNAHTGTNWTPAGIIAFDGNQLRAAATFDWPFMNAWAESNCGANPLGSPQTPTYALDTMPAIVNLFYHHNIAHDMWWKLGFTGVAGAMQAVNFEPGASPVNGKDPLLGMVQAAAVGGDLPPDDPLGRDNAYMLPLPDGLPSWSAMFLFQPIPPVPPSGAGFLAACVDGDFAADVIYHEYAHGVTSRWVGGESGNLESIQGGSMGESWSDLYAMHYLHANGLEKGTNLASYDTGSRTRSFRNWKIDQVKANYGDLGYDVAGEEVHSDGEIWNGAIWDLRSELMRLVKDKGQYAMQIVADAMPISGPSPSMLDMRDAILAADKARTKGKYQTAIWRVFARHGMGVSARTKDSADINPKPGFDHKDKSLNGRLDVKVVDATTGKAIPGARVMLGIFEARVTPVTMTGAKGTFNIPVQGGRTYPLTISAKGYGAQTAPVKITAKKTTSLRLALSVNFASRFAGAKVAAVSNPSSLGSPLNLLDDTEASTWWTDPEANANDSVVVDLAGSSPVTVKTIQLSALRSPGGSRFEALRQFEIQASTNGKTFKTVLKGSFPYAPPRPLTPDLRYRSWKLKGTVKATHLKLMARPMTAYGGGIQTAELQVFGTGNVRVNPAELGKDKPFHDEGSATVGSADANLTYNLMTSGLCQYPPPTQGLDAYVSVLPDSYGDGSHLIDARAIPVLPVDPRPDIDVYFLSANCLATGDVASTAPREVGTIPQGSKYAVIQLYTDLPVEIIIDARSP